MDKADKNVEIAASHLKILGQYFYALGHGARGMHITRKATWALYDRYRDHIHPEDWERDGIVVLYWIERIGALAAQLATGVGAVDIDADVLNEAAAEVERHVKATRCGSAPNYNGPIPDGKYCHNGN